MPETPIPNDSEQPANFEDHSEGQDASRPGGSPKAFVLRKQALPDFNERLSKLAQTPTPKVPSIKELRANVPAQTPAAPVATPPPADTTAAPAATPAEPAKRVVRPRPEIKIRSSGLPSLKDYQKVLESPPPETPGTPEISPDPEPAAEIAPPEPPRVFTPGRTPSVPQAVSPRPAVPAPRPVAPAAAPVAVEKPDSSEAKPPVREFKLRGPVRATDTPASPEPAESKPAAPGLKLNAPLKPAAPVPSTPAPKLAPRAPDEDSALFDAVVDASFTFTEDEPARPMPPPASETPSEPGTPKVPAAKPAAAEIKVPGQRMVFKSRVEKTDATPAPQPAPPPPPPPPPPVATARPSVPAPTPVPPSDADPAKPKLGLKPSSENTPAQRISLPRQTAGGERPVGQPLHEQFDLNSLVAGEESPPAPANDPAPAPAGGRRSSFTIKARPSPKPDDALLDAAPSAPVERKNTPPVVYPRTSGTLPPIAKTQAPTGSPTSTTSPFKPASPAPSPATGKTLPPFEKGTPAGKVAVIGTAVVGLILVGAYFGYGWVKENLSGGAGNPVSGGPNLTVPTPPPVPPVAPATVQTTGETPKPAVDSPSHGTAPNANATTPGAETTTLATAPTPTPVPTPVSNIPPPAANVPPDPKVQELIDSYADHITIIKMGTNSTLLMRNERYAPGKMFITSVQLRYLGVEPSPISPDKKIIVFEDGRGARYKLAF